MQDGTYAGRSSQAHRCISTASRCLQEAEADADDLDKFAKQRQAIIARNRARMQELDLPAIAAKVLAYGRWLCTLLASCTDSH